MRSEASGWDEQQKVCSERRHHHPETGDLYQAWRKPGIILNCIPDAQAVDVLDDKHARWIVDIPDKGFSSWESEITGDQENRVITCTPRAWAGYGHEGSVRLHPGPERPGHGGGARGVQAPLRRPRHERDRQARGPLAGRLHLQGPAQLQAAHGDVGEVATNMGPSGRDAGAEAVERGGGAS